MVKAKKKVSKIKSKKKFWYSIIAPKLFGHKEIGETYRSSPNSALGRVFKVNLRDLTGDLKYQNVYISFRICKMEGNTLHTKVIGYELSSAFVKRLVRKNTARLDDCVVLPTKSGEKVIVKSLIITMNRTQRSVRTELRKQFYSLLEKELSETDFSTFVSNIVYKRINLGFKKKLSKIYPLKEVAFRVVALREEKSVPKNDVTSVKEETPVKVAAEA